MGQTANRRLLRRVVGWLIVVIWFLSARNAKAQVVINEFLPDPTDENDLSEWIELYNSGSNEVNVAGWLLDDSEGGTKPYTLPQYILSPGSFWVIEKIDSHIGLNNTEDQVRLLDSDNHVVDQVSYRLVPEGKSYGRVPDGTNNWQIIDLPSKNQLNSVPLSICPSPTAEPTMTVISLKITLVIACPENGGKEGVKIMNLSVVEVVMDEYVITDSAGNRQSLSGILSGSTEQEFFWDKSFINNSGDEISLLDTNGKVLDTIKTPDCTKTSYPDLTSTPKPTFSPTPKPTELNTPTGKVVTLGKVLAATQSGNIPASHSARLVNIGIINRSTLSGELASPSAGTVRNAKEQSSGVMIILGGLCLTAGAGYTGWRKYKQTYAN